MSLIQRAAQWLVKLGSPAPDDDFWYTRVPGGRVGGVIDPNEALKNPATYACINLLADTVASMPPHIFRRLPNDGGKTRASEHRLYRTIHRAPNENQTAYEFWHLCVTHMMTAGNFYARQIVDSRNNVITMEPLDPTRVEPKKDTRTGVVFYLVQGTPGAPRRVMTADEVFHVPYLGYDGVKGFAPLEMFARTIGVSIDAEGYNAAFFARNGMSPVYFSTPGRLAETTRKQLRDYLRDFTGPRGWMEPGIFEGGVKPEALPLDHQKLQLLESQRWMIEQIARIFRVPPHMIGHLDRATFSNIEHQAIEFVMHTIRPIVARIEQRINASLLGAREGNEYFAEWVLEALLRGDADSRSNYLSRMIQFGMMTPNEARSRENLNAMEGGDQLFVNSTMVPMAQAGQNANQAQEQQAAAPVINVTAAATPPPPITVEVTIPQLAVKRSQVIERDAEGRISGVVTKEEVTA